MVAPASSGVTAKQADALWQKAETSRRREDYRVVLDRLQASDQNDVQILWRLARASKDVCKDESLSATEREQLVRRGVDYTEQATQLDAREFKGFLWRGILLGLLTDYLGLYEKVKTAYGIRDAFKKAVELSRSRDAESVHCLGQLYFTLADQPAFERKASSAIGLSGSFEEALEQFLLAEKAQPDYVTNLHMLGRCLVKLGQPQRAEAYLKRVLTLRVSSPDDQATLVEARKLLDKIASPRADGKTLRQAADMESQMFDEESKVEADMKEISAKLRAKLREFSRSSPTSLEESDEPKSKITAALRRLRAKALPICVGPR